jgi:hypothetical protein
LRSLDLSKTIHLLDDRALEYISQLCPDLEELDISSIRANVTALHQLSDSLSKLKKIAYREMPNMNDKCLWYLFKSNGKNLKHIDLRGCNRLKGRCFKNLGVHLEEVSTRRTKVIKKVSRKQIFMAKWLGLHDCTLKKRVRIQLAFKRFFLFRFLQKERRHFF